MVSSSINSLWNQRKIWLDRLMNEHERQPHADPKIIIRVTSWWKEERVVYRKGGQTAVLRTLIANETRTYLYRADK